MNLDGLLKLFAESGCVGLYAKALAENDNSKNQIYLAGNVEALNILPSKKIFAHNLASGPSFKAQVDFSWLLSNGDLIPAPGAQFILYAQYPEVRFSGFLQGARGAPSELLAKRLKGRILFFGVTKAKKILGFAVGIESEIASQYRARYSTDTRGVLTEISLPSRNSADDSRSLLLKELHRIHSLGWINSKQLSEDNEIGPCTAPQCGGFTLEAELGIPKNSRSEPDIYGWEIKQFAVPEFDRLNSGRITLMTPEPNGGLYRSLGVEGFIRRFGYKDKMGRPDRINVGGIHRVDSTSPATGLTLKLVGYEKAKNRIKDADGALVLQTKDGEDAASWSFESIIQHWIRKHSKAVYVPSMRRTEPRWQYSYGSKIKLAERTDALKLFKAMSDGDVFYDPGIKLENASTSRPTTKRRSQFRIGTSNIDALYHQIETVDVKDI